MPAYLRWIASLSAGLTAQFIFFIAAGALAVGTGNTEIQGGSVGLLITFGSVFAGMIPAVGVNSWLIRRYPTPELVREMQAVLDQPSSDSK